MLTSLIIDIIPDAVRTLRKISSRAMDKDLTFQQLRVLFLIHEGMTITQIAGAVQVSTAAISKMADNLTIKGFLLREAGPDRRSLKLTLTKKGDSKRRLVKGAVQKEVEKKLSKLSAEEQHDLKKGLLVLSKLMGYLNEK